MVTIGADLIPGAADDHARLVALQPQPHAWGIQAAQREINLAKKRRQRLDIRRAAPLKIHPSSQPFATIKT